MPHVNSTITEELLRAVPEPSFTESWHPISHGRVLDVMKNVADEVGLKIQKQCYNATEDLNCFTGAWTFSDGGVKYLGSEDHALYQCILFRNSINKSYSFGINGGTDSWVCSNLAIFGRFIEFRRHTSGMDDNELERVVRKGLDAIIPVIKARLEWHDSLRLYPLEEKETKALAYDAINQRIISRQAIPTFHNLLFGENHRYDPLTLFGFHGACTEILRDMNLANNGDWSALGKQEKLHNMVMALQPMTN